MTNNLIEMSEDEFDKKYPVLKNHLNPNATWVYGEGPGCLFETYGDELAFILQQDPRTVWTLVDGDDGDQYVESGFHFVNRIGYLVSTVPVPESIDIEVRIPMEADNDEPEPAIDVQHTASLQPDALLEAIARRHLSIPTLEARRSDSLAFHEVAVWKIRSALKAAFDAGAKTGPVPTTLSGLPTPYDAYEIHGMKRLPNHQGHEEEPLGPVINDCEQVSEDEAESWSLFGHIPGQGIDCIGEFATREHAEEVFARITGRAYTTGNSDRGRRDP